MDIKGEDNSRGIVFLLLLRFHCEPFWKEGFEQGTRDSPFWNSLFSFLEMCLFKDLIIITFTFLNSPIMGSIDASEARYLSNARPFLEHYPPSSSLWTEKV